MLDLTAGLDSGFLPVRVKINGTATDVNVDLYDANNHLVAFIEKNVPAPVPAAVDPDADPDAEVVPAPDQDVAGNLEHARRAVVAYFKGVETDWSYYAAGRFWEEVVKAVNDLGKGGSASDTPS